MRYTSLSLAFAIIFSFFIIQPSASAKDWKKAEDIKTQGDLCKWLIYTIGVYGPQGLGPNGPVGPAVDGETACNFLKEIVGVQPEEGWYPNPDDREQSDMTREQLAGICLGYPNVIEKVRPYESSEETQNAVTELLQGDDPNREKFNKILELVKNCVEARIPIEKPAVFRDKVQTPHLEPI